MEFVIHFGLWKDSPKPSITWRSHDVLSRCLLMRFLLTSLSLGIRLLPVSHKISKIHLEMKFYFSHFCLNRYSGPSRRAYSYFLAYTTIPFCFFFAIVKDLFYFLVISKSLLFICCDQWTNFVLDWRRPDVSSQSYSWCFAYFFLR